MTVEATEYPGPRVKVPYHFRTLREGEEDEDARAYQVRKEFYLTILVPRVRRTPMAGGLKPMMDNLKKEPDIEPDINCCSGQAGHCEEYLGDHLSAVVVRKSLVKEVPYWHNLDSDEEFDSERIVHGTPLSRLG